MSVTAIVRRTAAASHARLAATLCIVLSLAGCEVIGGIFKAGMWVGVIVVVAVIALVVWGVSKVRK